jgi:hypothetical protein
MSCPCDELTFPALPLAIPPGLSDLPRQFGGFPEFRAAMLAAVPSKTPLAQWRARDRDDFGLLLIDWWAYVCDSIGFYDQVLADESYLRTAKLRSSVRRLTGLIGYVPRPAISAAVHLGMLADGRKPVAVPAGTAVRSAAFDGQPPQMFETSADVTIHPDANRWGVSPPRGTSLSGTISSLLLGASTRVKTGSVLLLEFGGVSMHRYVRVAKAVTPTVEADGGKYARLDLDAPITLPAAKSLAAVRLRMATQSASPWLHAHVSGEPQPVAVGHVVLDGVYRHIKNGDFVILKRDGADADLYLVKDHAEPLLTILPATTIDVGGTKVTIPPVRTAATQLNFDVQIAGYFAELSSVSGTTAASTSLEYVSGDTSVAYGVVDTSMKSAIAVTPPQYTVHFGLIDVGGPTAAASTVLDSDDPIVLTGMHLSPLGSPAPTSFLLSSADERGLEVGASVSFATRHLTLNTGTLFSPPLELPVSVYGNVVAATRGERVPREVLGSGDASQASQSFTLENKPLTYVPSVGATSEWGAASTLTVWVDGLQWTEVPSFFSAAPDAQVFVVRELDDGSSRVTFGDGVRGARLSTGADNVVASYRFGAGAAVPPANSIKQLARPVPGLKSVVDPVGAAGGSDAETLAELSVKAPRSALLLGRAVSIRDIETAAAAVAGVRAASAEWRWQSQRQRPVAHVWFIGSSALESTVSQRLRALSDPSTPIHVEVAAATPVTLKIDIETDPRRLAGDVIAAVKQVLLASGTGMLVPERLGIGQPLFRSQLFRTVLSVPGAESVRAVTWNGTQLHVYGKSPGAGHYFDFETPGLALSGSPGGG